MASAVVRRLLNGVIAMNASAKQRTAVWAHQKGKSSSGREKVPLSGGDPSFSADEAIYPSKMDLNNPDSGFDGPSMSLDSRFVITDSNPDAEPVFSQGSGFVVQDNYQDSRPFPLGFNSSIDPNSLLGSWPEDRMRLHK